jgi:molybdopterin/thiamine biosynthesis adenylyltransferase
MSATSEEAERYGRQMLVPSMGRVAQAQFKASSVIIVGGGGIGSTVALYLAGAGIGKIEVVDFDVVEIGNLHRQIIHDTSKQGMHKAESAADRLRALNPTIEVIGRVAQLDASNIAEIIRDYDIVIDATDNFSARYIINDACVLSRKPLISGSAVGMEGQITVIKPFETPCYRCIYPQPSLSEGAITA